MTLLPQRTRGGIPDPRADIHGSRLRGCGPGRDRPGLVQRPPDLWFGMPTDFLQRVADMFAHQELGAGALPVYNCTQDFTVL